MKIYLIVYEDGEYSDWRVRVESLHWTYKDAVDTLEYKPVTLKRGSFKGGFFSGFDYINDPNANWYEPSMWLFAHRHRIPETKWRPQYDQSLDGYVWVLDDVTLYSDAIWYIIEKEIDPPRNIAALFC